MKKAILRTCLVFNLLLIPFVISSGQSVEKDTQYPYYNRIQTIVGFTYLNGIKYEVIESTTINRSLRTINK